MRNGVGGAQAEAHPSDFTWQEQSDIGKLLAPKAHSLTPKLTSQNFNFSELKVGKYGLELKVFGFLIHHKFQFLS